MKQETITRIKLTASEGKKLTNGKDYVEETFLAVGKTADDWYEITEEEYEEIVKKQEEELNIL